MTMTIREHPQRATLETFYLWNFDQSDEEKLPDKQKDNDNYKDNDNNKVI